MPHSTGTTVSREDARRRAELAAAQVRIEARQAQQLIDRFVQRAEAAGIPPVPLRAALIGSGARVRTDKSGWYLKHNQSLAIGTDGGYYVLVGVPGGWRARLHGVRLEPSPPPLVVGRGGRDGETGPLTDFLEAVLVGNRVDRSTC